MGLTSLLPRSTDETARAAEGAPLARVIAFANQKGGVAKTTSTLNLGVALAEQRLRVLAVDLAPQGTPPRSQADHPAADGGPPRGQGPCGQPCRLWGQSAPLDMVGPLSHGVGAHTADATRLQGV